MLTVKRAYVRNSSLIPVFQRDSSYESADPAAEATASFRSQALQQLFQSGHLAQAEVRVQTMLANYPNALALYNILGLCQQAQGKYREAVTSFRKMLSFDQRVAELHFNLGGAVFPARRNG